MQFAIQDEQLYAECGARLKNIYLLFALLFIIFETKSQQSKI